MSGMIGFFQPPKWLAWLLLICGAVAGFAATYGVARLAWWAFKALVQMAQ